MGMRLLDESEFNQFQSKVKEAEKDVMNRDRILDQIYDEYERNLVLIGATAVEDRLQENAPETIRDL